jgi:PAS domain S-box-containing protein
MESIASAGDLLQELAAIVAAIAALGGAVWAIFKWVIPIFGRVNKSFRSIEFVVRELQPNGGSSLRDVINRLEKSVLEVQRDATRMDARQWAIVGSLRDPIWESDPDGLCIRVNQAMLSLTGRSVQEYLGNNWETTIHPGDRSAVFDEWTSAVERRRLFEMHYRVISKDGSVHEVEAVAAPYLDQRSGAIMGWVGRYASVKKLT